MKFSIRSSVSFRRVASAGLDRDGNLVNDTTVLIVRTHFATLLQPGKKIDENSSKRVGARSLCGRITSISFDMGRQWMHRYDHSRTLTAENSPLKAETGVRFPLGSANNFNRLDQFSDLLSQPFFNFSPTVFHYGGLGNSIHGCQRGCLPFFGEPVDP